jgi:hypothetical protein
MASVRFLIGVATTVQNPPFSKRGEFKEQISLFYGKIPVDKLLLSTAAFCLTG